MHSLCHIQRLANFHKSSQRAGFPGLLSCRQLLPPLYLTSADLSLADICVLFHNRAVPDQILWVESAELAEAGIERTTDAKARDCNFGTKTWPYSPCASGGFATSGEREAIREVALGLVEIKMRNEFGSTDRQGDRR